MTDPALQRVLDAAVPFALRLRRTFRGVDVREGMLLRGPSGWGEFAPFDDYDDRRAARWLAAALEASFGSWPASWRPSIAVNAIIPACAADDAAILARTALLDHGCRTMKVKVGGSLAEDEARIASVRDVLDASLGSGVGRIRLDANAAWDVDRAVTSLHRLAAYGIEYVEQPCPDLDDLRVLRARIEVPIAVDEGLRTSDDPQALAAAGERLRAACDVIILKAAPLGGVDAAMRIADAVALPVVVSGSLDSSVGLAPSLALAGALDLDVACGLGTGALLRDDLVDPPLQPMDGELPVVRPAPDLDALLAARDRIGLDRAAWWGERLRRAWDAGAGAQWRALVEAAP